MSRISIIIITKNEEKNIRECLESVLWANEIVIVDDKSIDRTVEIESEYTNKIFIRDLDNFSMQKNFGQNKASNEWILQVDADERVTKELKDEILGIIVSEDAKDGYYLSRKQYLFGKWIKYGGWYPNYQLRLYKKNKGKWFKPIHERVKVEGETAILQNPLIHFTASDITSFIAKNNLYTSFQAEFVYQLGDKAEWYKLIYSPLKKFCREYLLLMGFRDGWHGFIIAVLGAYNSFIFRAKLWELVRKNKHKIDK